MKIKKSFSYYFFCLLFVLNSVQSYTQSFENQEDRKKALIFGVTGQDGNYLTEFLLNKNYEVHGVARHFPSGHQPIKKFIDSPHFFFHIGNITDYSELINLIRDIQPHEIYNLAAQTHVKVSFDEPEETTKINALGTLYILEAIRKIGLEQQTKFFQASSSELFGIVKESPQTENTPFHPCSPYGIAKLYGYWMTVNYRDSYGIFACNGILFNHESPLRGEAFVTRKISLAACRYKLGLQKFFI